MLRLDQKICNTSHGFCLSSSRKSAGVTFLSDFHLKSKTAPRGLQNVAFPKGFWPPPAGAAHPGIFYPARWRDARTENADTPADPVWPTPRAHVRTGRTYAVQGTGFALPPSLQYSTSSLCTRYLCVVLVLSAIQNLIKGRPKVYIKKVGGPTRTAGF